MRPWWLILLLTVPLTSAHVPDFDGAGTSRDQATRVDDPTKSWVFFGHMDAGERWYRLDLREGDTMFVSLSVPADAVERPTLWLTSDALVNGTQVPVVADVGVEPFTPVALRTVAELRETVDRNHTVYAVVVAPDATQFALGIGQRESFTPVEWVRVPVDRIAIQTWAGVPAALAVCGEVLAIAFVLWRHRVGSPPQLLQRLGAAAVMGTAGTTGILAAIAGSQGGLGPGIMIPLLFMALAAAIGWAAWRARRRWQPAMYAGLALAVWAGLWLGPALLLAASVWPRMPDGTVAGAPPDAPTGT